MKFENFVQISSNIRLECESQKKAQAFIDFNELSIPAVTQVVEFVKKLPGYHSLPSLDRQILLKNSCLEIMVSKL